MQFKLNVLSKPNNAKRIVDSKIIVLIVDKYRIIKMLVN